MGPRTFPVAVVSILVWLLAGASGVGCSRSRVVTISTIPPDATLRINDRAPVKGPVTETFTFGGDRERHLVQAQRDGYRTQVATITRDSPSGDSLVLEMKPIPRQVTFSVQPMPAVVKIDGKPVSSAPVGEITVPVEFRVDAAGRWSTHKVTVEHERFKPLERVVRYEDTQTVYKLDLEAMRKDLFIVTEPPKAQVFVNDELLGESPIEHRDFPFPVDPQTGTFAVQKLRIEKRGYETKEVEISWDNGKTNYDDLTLSPQKKLVRIRTDPPGANVRLGGQPIKADASGVHAYTLPFGPVNERGDLATYSGVVEKPRTADAEWEPQPFQIAWDEGRQDYTVKLKEILVRKVRRLGFRMDHADTRWSVLPESTVTTAMKDETDGPDLPKAVKVTRQPKNTMIDSVTVSPDGQHVLYTILTEDGGALRSRLVVQPADGSSSAEPVQLNDGMSLEVTPSYTPDGSQVVFASNRAGRRLSIWSMPANDPQPVPEQWTGAAAGDGDDLWPSVDSNPRPWLFYESRIDTRPEPRLFAKPLDGNRKDLTVVPAGGTQPRVAPTADAVLFAVADAKTRKRDIYRMSNQGKDVTNLTNTPDVDEFDAAWSPDGLRIAYVSDSDRRTNPEAPDNLEIWLMDAAGGTPPVRVTNNPGWDDSPAWDAGGRAIYFRSNRGGEWNVWRIELK